MQGPGNTNSFLAEPDCQVVAACDLDKNHLDAALKKINEHYKNNDCKAYHDYRELMARKDIDAVMLAVPDNWHALVAIEALKNGKDIYGEKPLARTIAEQQAIVKAVQKNKRIWQTGSWQRSQDRFRIAAEIVRNGLIGKITEVQVGLPAGHTDFAGTKDKMQVTRAARRTGLRNVDRPRADGALHRRPRAQELALELQHRRRPVARLDRPPLRHRALGHGLRQHRPGRDETHPAEFPPEDAVWNTATKYHAEGTYANGIKMIIRNGNGDIEDGHQVDRHRRLGLGGPRRLRRLEGGTQESP